MPPARDAARRLLAALVLAVASLSFAGPFVADVGAHAVLVESRPGNDEVVADPPAEVVLVFDQAVGAPDGAVRVIGPDGARIERGAPRSEGAGLRVVQGVDRTGPGTSTVSYRVLSADGHVISGSFVYHVERRTGAADLGDEGPPASVAVVGLLGRWLAFAGALLAGGVVVVGLFVDGGRRTGEPLGAALAGLRRPLLVGAGVALVVGTAVALVAAVADLRGVSLAAALGDVPDAVTSSRPGTVAGLRVLAALVVLVAALALAKWRGVAGPVVAAAVLASLVLPAFGGHASTTSPAALAVAADAAHVALAAVWVGGLAVLVLTWDANRDRLLAFSRLAVVAAPVLVVSGAALGWLQTRSLAALTDTDYGRMVLAKAVGALVLVLIGWVHRRHLADAARSVAGLVPTMRVQVALGVAVLAVTAVLVDTPPAVDTLSEPVERIAQAGDTTVRLQVTPARSGPNEVHLYYLSRDGSLAPVDAAELEVSTADVEPRRVPLTVVTSSHSLAGGVQLTSGTWRFELTVVSRGVPARATFEVPVR